MGKSNKLVSGIGHNSGKYPTRKEGSFLKEYDLWKSMLLRCTEKGWDKFPNYTGVTCSDNFKNYSFFYEWCQQQVGFGSKDKDGRSFEIDKDLLIKDNKVYSEDTCIFIPRRLNSLVFIKTTVRGKYPIGVYFNHKTNKFNAFCHRGTGTKKNLGCFDTELDAFVAYKTFKESLIRQLAEDYKGQVDIRLYQALLNYKVEITD